MANHSVEREPDVSDLINQLGSLPPHVRKKLLRRTNKVASNASKSMVSNITPLTQHEKHIKIDPILPRSKKQVDYIAALRNGLDRLIIAHGVWGSGKTKVASHVGLELMFDQNHPCDGLIIARPSISGENEIGFEPGDKNEKLAGWCKPITLEIGELIGKSFTDTLIRTEKIELLNIDQLKGRTFVNKFVIIDECEDLSFTTLKNLVARHGESNITVLCGDVAQIDRTHKESIKSFSSSVHGFDAFIQIMTNFIEDGFDASIFNFDNWDTDCVRSAISRDFGKRLAAIGVL